jgi:hypothetical protein
VNLTDFNILAGRFGSVLAPSATAGRGGGVAGEKDQDEPAQLEQLR